MVVGKKYSAPRSLSSLAASQSSDRDDSCCRGSKIMACKFMAQEKKHLQKLLMSEDERIKTALAHKDTIRLTLHTIERLKMAASHGQTWDDVINNLLDVYYDDSKEKKKRGK